MTELLVAPGERPARASDRIATLGDVVMNDLEQMTASSDSGLDVEAQPARAFQETIDRVVEACFTHEPHVSELQVVSRVRRVIDLLAAAPADLPAAQVAWRPDRSLWLSWGGPAVTLVLPEAGAATWQRRDGADVATTRDLAEATRWLAEAGVSAEDLFTLLETVSAQYARGERNEALDRLYDRVDDELLDGRTSDVDALLGALEVEDVPDAIVVGLLTITRSWRGELPARDGLCRRARGRLAPELLDGLD